MKLLFCSLILLVSVTTAQAVTPDDPPPTQILTCGGSVITDTGTSSLPSTSVSYKNGLDTWSFDTIQAVKATRQPICAPLNRGLLRTLSIAAAALSLGFCKSRAGQ
jgi:hypothetical protein